MKLGENIIAESGVPTFYRVSGTSNLGLAPSTLRDGEAVRAYVRSLSGFQKEALVVSARSGKAWRLVSDEGAYLSGHDAAPCPLAFFTVGMAASYAEEIVALARQRDAGMTHLRLILNNGYTMQGSMRRRTMVGGALAPDLDVEIGCDLPEHEVQELLAQAVAASPLQGLLHGQVPSLFSLSRNGVAVATGRAQPVQGTPLPAPEDAVADPEPTDLTLVERIGVSPQKAVTKGTRAAASSLSDEQDRVLNPAAILTLRSDGLKEIVQYLYSPRGSAFRFLSEEAEVNGGKGRAPDAMSLVSAGIGFCFMTQFGRMASMEKLDLPHYAIVQDTHFSLGGASGGTGEAGRAAPVETHVHLTTEEPDKVAQDMLEVSERTCFLHALCRTDLRTKLRVTRV